MRKSTRLITTLVGGCALISCSGKRYNPTGFDIIPGTRKIIFSPGNSVFLGDEADDSNDLKLEIFGSFPLSTYDGQFIYVANDGLSIQSIGISPAIKINTGPASTVSQLSLSEDNQTLFYVGSSKEDRGTTIERTDAIYMMDRAGKSPPKKLVEFYNVSLSPRSNLADRLYFVAAKEYDSPNEACFYDYKLNTATSISTTNKPCLIICSKETDQVAMLVREPRSYDFELLVFSNPLGSRKSVYRTHGYISTIAFAEDGKSILICEDATLDNPKLLRLDLKTLTTTVLRSLRK